MAQIKTEQGTLTIEDLQWESVEKGHADTSIPRFVCLSCRFEAEGFSGQSRVQIIKPELEKFINKLRVAYQLLKQPAKLVNFEGDVELSFIPELNGRILIKGIISSVQHAVGLHFQLESDQAHLPDFIQELEQELKGLTESQG